MHLFRRILHLKQAQTRLATRHDLPHITNLMRDGARRYYGMTGDELSRLLATVPAVVIDSGSELWAFAIPGWNIDQTTWLRGIAIARGLDTTEAVSTLLPFLHNELSNQGIRTIFYAGDETTDRWLVPLLRVQDYIFETKVVVYEKHNLTIPDQGNPNVRLRPAALHDMDTIRTLDYACFEPQWRKDDIILTTALTTGPLFILAEMELDVVGYQVVGYAYASSHFNGRLVHLVRIAVDPQHRGNAIGVRLLAEVVAFARAQGSYVITLNTQSYNLRAQNLYHWFGFTPSGESQEILRHDL